MFIFSIRAVVLAAAVSASSLSNAAALCAQSGLLCSPEGLMRLIPQFNVNGQFTIPDPNADLPTFLSAQQGLLNAVDMILAQENINQNPSDVGSLPSRPLIFGSNWLSSEVGIKTDGTNLNSPESGGQFGGYRVQSFLTGLTPVPLSQGSIYAIKQSNPTYHALVYPMPTSHPCVNRLVLAANNTVGSWPTPTYALGRYQLDNNGLPMRDKPLITYLIANICLDLGEPVVINGQSALRPNAMIFLALHWLCESSTCANNGIVSVDALPFLGPRHVGEAINPSERGAPPDLPARREGRALRNRADAQRIALRVLDGAGVDRRASRRRRRGSAGCRSPPSSRSFSECRCGAGSWPQTSGCWRGRPSRSASGNRCSGRW
jgi:hypothetical protein